MGIVKADISVTLDGFGAGDNQSLERPFGDFDVLAQVIPRRMRSRSSVAHQLWALSTT